MVLKRQACTCVFLLFMGLPSSLLASTITQPGQQQNKKYATKQAYILDKFRCAVEFGRGLHGRSDGKGHKYQGLFNWGIRLGYYIHKYHHVPTKKDDFEPYYMYDPLTKERILTYPSDDISGEGEGSILIEISVKVPHEEHALAHLDGDFVIIEKFIFLPIVLTWTRPLKSWEQSIFYSVSFGGYIKYLLSSRYVADANAKKLPLGKAGSIIDLKNYIKEINLFSYGVILLEIEVIFPMGLYVNFVATVPGDTISSFFSSEDIFSKDISKPKKQINAAYIEESRRYNYDNAWLFNIGVDFIKLYKCLKNL